MHALHLLVLSLAAAGGPGGGRAGADSARVATLLAALAHTDPVVCDLIGDQLGNFWIGGDPARLGRFSDAPNVQGAKDSLAGTITDPRAVALLVATLGTDPPWAAARRRQPGDEVQGAHHGSCPSASAAARRTLGSGDCSAACSACRAAGSAMWPRA